MRTPLAILALIPILSPAPLFAAEAKEYRCLIESRTNTSLGQDLPIREAEIVHPVSGLESDGPHLTRRAMTMEGDSEADTTHRITPATGEYRATTYLTDHRMGEQYVVETVGTCTLSSGTNVDLAEKD